MTHANADGGHALGVGLVLASTAAFALAGVLTKSIDADPLVIACWRGLVGGLFIGTYVLFRSPAAARRSAFRIGWRGWLMALVGGAASIAFIAAFKFTYVSNVTIIYATAPFAAALLEFVLLGQRLSKRTAMAATVSMAGVAIMATGGVGSINLLGDGLALAMTLGSALYMVMIRAFRDTQVVWVGAVSGFMLFTLGWVLADPLAVAPGDTLLLVAFGASYALAVILWTEGTRLVTAAESGLIGTAEVPLAILFGLLFLAEIPPWASFTGGAVVLAAVLAHARCRPTAAAPPAQRG
jgi:drug/metabolite transporter (DMT)-like permease